MTETEIATKLTQVEERSKSNTHRIDKLESQTDALTSIATSIAVMANEQKTISEKMENIDAKVDKLEQVPRDRWNGIVGSSIAALVGGIIAFMLTRILGG